MSITFHCNHCNKKIEAADSSGGKWGKCPACHNKVYVPDLNATAGEELKLAPLDSEEEARKKSLMQETFNIEQTILSERETPKEGQPQTAESKPAQMSEKELTKRVIAYLRMMADGQIREAEQIVKVLKVQGISAVKVIDRIALSDIPEPELADIPAQVLSGFIRNLRSCIS
ncbi:MAG: hypothetical protein H8D47_01560 [Planctomycetes bacterium]|nr:hypothetical protein [Planctomycetota bacterium]MBL7106362.1 hypothetical protein [Phycisphaerae bacterium]